MPYNLIIGASSAIAQAFIQQQLIQGQSVVAISRNQAPFQHNHLEWLVWNSQENEQEREIKELVDLLLNSDRPVCRIGIFLGLLHGETIQPEKRLEECRLSNLQQVFQINIFWPLLWLSQLIRLLQRPVQRKLKRVEVVVLGARVGSIADNRAGGWYSYRASKAALNMACQTASIELARRAKNAKLICFHPGTTDSQLSKPFQARVTASKLFSPEFVAQRLLSVMEQAPLDGQLSYLDWNNKPIDW